nr:MAG TPA: hypothetical protein [Caudoviricetes sp.]
MRKIAVVNIAGSSEIIRLCPFFSLAPPRKVDSIEKFKHFFRVGGNFKIDHNKTPLQII